MKSVLRIGFFTTALAAALLPGLRAADQTPPPAAGDQNPAPAPPRWRRGAMRNRLQHLGETLNLTQEQKDQITAIWKEHTPQLQGLRDDEARARDERRAKLQEIRQDMRTKVRAVLTPEQQAKFDTLPRREWGTRGRGPGREAPPAGGSPADHQSPPSDKPAADASASPGGEA